jgi:hypothetical protein
MKLKILRGAIQIAAALAIGVPMASASPVCISPGPGQLLCSNTIFTPNQGAADANGEVAVPWSSNVQVDRFDTTGGLILDSAQLALSYSTTGTIRVNNNDGVNDLHFFGAHSSVPLTITGPPGDTTVIHVNANTANIDSNTSTANQVFDPNDLANYPKPGVANAPVPHGKYATVPPTCFPNPPGPDICLVIPTLNIYTGLQGSGSANNNVNNLAAYTGVGPALLDFQVCSASVDCAHLQGASFGVDNAPALLSFSASARAGGAVSILYTYHTDVVGPVPEPVTMMLVGSAMLGFGVAFRRKRKGQV